ncbi:TetR/AcrR family transcriptional regulator [Agrobacterium tumefaciens]|uniref:TetR/AcrR family transcriptional regulator n=2 Tax=Agrobacterium tumefaciens TaxID=358 RepID=A0AAP9J703_AGRTU|nr:TetR/AcrR family transcriptional regulator [Agrobacterium tumefaciens]NSZ58446.1 TetR/AcrR family transcriptional regulator [Agrobacterium tumefaciens]QDY95455.1 TetR/AcrR family transcriptional regulator [Agrobacterium tumefaciens]UXS50548.1 TetR/AcrR family transcriptional regulator [Agrobacterium tumefaciens]UXS71791.1 TetR/AcrR family transcriptional regulator [Agrobacterium tumefaciens]UXS79458.1 TetR/AcrR family transcriptional regulator [Agrobacterium tumefaciens]
MAAPRGRPRSFDRDHALERVMEVFWAKGYEGAQINDLIAAIGVTPPSFYAAFGSKETAFREAVDLYMNTVGARSRDALDNAATASEALRDMLIVSIDVSLSTKPGGCLLILGVVNCLPENEAVRDHLFAARRKTVEAIAFRLERGVREGDLPSDTNVPDLANFFHGIVQAISFQARDGATRPQLEALIEPALTVLR